MMCTTDNKMNELLKLIEDVSAISFVDPRDIPKIDLYMDQVTTFFEGELKNARRRDDEKTMTGTMINNYVKAGVIPKPNGRKYTRSHMISLTYVFILKHILSIQDIKNTLSVLDESGTLNNGVEMEEFYNIYLNLMETIQEEYKDNTIKRINTIKNTLSEHNDFNSCEFEQLMLLMTLVTEASLNKILCQRMIDSLFTSEKVNGKKDNSKKEGSKKDNAKKDRKK